MSLQNLQSATRATMAARTTAGALAADIKIQVPETVISIGEIDRLLHRYPVHDLHINRTLIRGPDDTGTPRQQSVLQLLRKPFRAPGLTAPPPPHQAR